VGSLRRGVCAKFHRLEEVLEKRLEGGVAGVVLHFLKESSLVVVEWNVSLPAEVDKRKQVPMAQLVAQIRRHAQLFVCLCVQTARECAERFKKHIGRFDEVFSALPRRVEILMVPFF